MQRRVWGMDDMVEHMVARDAEESVGNDDMVTRDAEKRVGNDDTLPPPPLPPPPVVPRQAEDARSTVIAALQQRGATAPAIGSDVLLSPCRRRRSARRHSYGWSNTTRGSSTITVMMDKAVGAQGVALRCPIAVHGGATEVPNTQSLVTQALLGLDTDIWRP
eukprot:1185115-Prorocentrum_minimum.AAC.5